MCGLPSEKEGKFYYCLQPKGMVVMSKVHILQIQISRNFTLTGKYVEMEYKNTTHKVDIFLMNPDDIISFHLALHGFDLKLFPKISLKRSASSIMVTFKVIHDQTTETNCNPNQTEWMGKPLHTVLIQR